MQTEALHQLIAEMAEQRRQQQENCLLLRQSAFTFKTGLLNVQRNIAQTAEKFCSLTGQTDAMVIEMHRRAS